MTKTKNLTTASMMIAITAVCAQLMLPFGAVQFSMQVFAVFLAAALLPPLWSAGAMTAYLLLGAVGAPVFGGFRGGPSVLFGVTGGFIIAFPLMAGYISAILKRLKARRFLPLLLIMCSSLVICYIVGCLWFAAVAGAPLSKALSVAVLPFIIPDVLKAALAAWLAIRLRKVIHAA
ncbi:MAG: biotin transporter BioY [Angelakisella sp.]